MVRRFIPIYILALVLASLGAGSSQAAEFKVNSTFNDAEDPSTLGDGQCLTKHLGESMCTLRAAIQESNALTGPDVIRFDLPSGSIIRIAIEALPKITDELTIQGPGASQLAIDGGGSFRIFEIPTLGRDKTVTIANLTLQNGKSDFVGGAITSGEHQLVLSSVVIKDSQSGTDGGGLHVFYGDVMIVQSTLAGNGAKRSGGAIYNDSGNVALINSTISGNKASTGGGIYNAAGSLALDSCTVAFNLSSDLVGGIFNKAKASLKNTLLAKNNFTHEYIVSPNCSGELISQGHNFISQSQGCLISPESGAEGDIIGEPGKTLDPQLMEELKDNDGETPTHALASNSPAKDAGAAKDCPPSDQRNMKRPQGGRCDIGAYELVYIIPTEPLAPGVCGNGKLEDPEACDDGNTVSNDGCSDSCRKEGLVENQPGLPTVGSGDKGVGPDLPEAGPEKSGGAEGALSGGGSLLGCSIRGNSEAASLQGWRFGELAFPLIVFFTLFRKRALKRV